MGIRMSKQKIYIRKGRCFKEVPNYIGMFYDGEHFTTEHTNSSYAVCYDQRGITCYLANIEFEPNMFTFDKALALNRHIVHLPTREQAVMAFSRCPILRTERCQFSWTQEEYSNRIAWSLRWNCGLVDGNYKDGILCIRLFFEITIEV